MEARDLVAWALEASLFVEPRRPGLTTAELTELATHFGVTASALDNLLRGRAAEGGRIVPFGIDPSFFAVYEGDVRNVRAFDHVVATFKAVAEAAGQRPPMVDRDDVIASGTANGHAAADIEVAVAVYRAFEGVPEADGRWEIRRIKPTTPLPSAQREGPARKVTRRERYTELVGRVRELIERRPGRTPPASATSAAAAAVRPAPAKPADRIAPPPTSTPDDADAQVDPVDDGDDDDPGTEGAAILGTMREALPSLGQNRLVAWWGQLTRDLHAADQSGSHLVKLVLSATMAEAALSLACPRPRDAKADAKGKPVRWTLVETAKAASSIGVDEVLRARLERAHRARVRMNVGRVLEAAGPLSEVNSADAREAYKSMLAAVRLVVAWNQRRSR